ncbi:hypothetical protein RE069_000140 [Klebsiella aerogenes]|nr:hypothetical protein [Klebsiella aerogenes]
MNNENELTAALLTIEKCREQSGCPAGVDLQNWVKQLAAENVGLKEALWWLYEVVSSDCVFIPDEKYSSVTNAAHVLLDTPAIDRIIAGKKADGVEEFAAYCGEENSVFVEAKAYYRSLPDAAYEFSSMLREGAEK